MEKEVDNKTPAGLGLDVGPRTYWILKKIGAIL